MKIRPRKIAAWAILAAFGVALAVVVGWDLTLAALIGVGLGLSLTWALFEVLD